MTKETMKKLKNAIFIIEDVEREIRNGSVNTTDGESGNGSGSDRVYE